MKEFIVLNEIVPDVVDRIMSYFAAEEGKTLDDARSEKRIDWLIEQLSKEYNSDLYQYIKEFVALCERLCEVSPLVRFKRDEFFGSTNCYYWNGKLSDGSIYTEANSTEKESKLRYWENAAFGFRYIAKKYKTYVLPIIYTFLDGRQSIGTGFVLGKDYVVTARHCLEGSKSICIEGLEYDVYKDAHVYYHSNRYIDVAVICIKRIKGCGFSLKREYKVLDSVMTMGYPKIPGFTCFQTVEEAIISSIPKERFTVTSGQVAAEAQELWSKEHLMLITAKIKSGNSGGPVINSYGECIGVVSAKAVAEGDYDDLGYGTAVPIEFAYEIIKNIDDHYKDEKVTFVECD
ncbi:MAG: trypsin-like peptidase domain-containing protein [Firmicutes bacterium]|nr:trypsin-like peptidase domain-containing protein [Bacillota bacterium]